MKYIRHRFSIDTGERVYDIVHTCPQREWWQFGLFHTKFVSDMHGEFPRDWP